MPKQSEAVLMVLLRENFHATSSSLALTNAGKRDVEKQANDVSFETARKMCVYWNAILRMKKALTAKKVEYIRAKIQERADKLAAASTPPEAKIGKGRLGNFHAKGD